MSKWTSVRPAGLALATLTALATQALAPQAAALVEIAASPARVSAAPGATVALFVDGMPRQNIHVYAPGATDYVPITLTVAAVTGVAVRPLKYPASETLIFDGGAVPVFQKPFRLIQEVVLASTFKPNDVVALHGTVDYQACDNKVCFKPVSVPVSWTIDVKKAGGK